MSARKQENQKLFASKNKSIVYLNKMFDWISFLWIILSVLSDA